MSVEPELIAAREHVERVRPILSLVLVPVAGVGAGQTAQHHRSRHGSPGENFPMGSTPGANSWPSAAQISSRRSHHST